MSESFICHEYYRQFLFIQLYPNTLMIISIFINSKYYLITVGIGFHVMVITSTLQAEQELCKNLVFYLAILNLLNESGNIYIKYKYM